MCKPLSNIILEAKNPIRKMVVVSTGYGEYADDDDSVFSQSSSKAPRKNLQPNWRFLGVKHNSEFSSQQIQTWLAELAAVKMAKAGPIEEIRSGKNEIGGFRVRLAHVSEIFIFPVSHISLLTCF
jgi:hypothetical protein